MDLVRLLQRTSGSKVLEADLPLLCTVMVVSFLLYCLFKSQRRFAHDKDLGIKHGCLPMETWIPCKWPWALDILKRQYDALPDQRILMFQSQYFDKTGPNITFKLFGKQGYLTADPKTVESILSANFEDWCLGSRRPGLMPLMGEGIFTQDGRPWKHSRELLRRQFARLHRQDCKVLDAHVEDLISTLSATGGLIDQQPHFFRFTLATTTALIFGGPVSALPREETDLFENAFDYASSDSALRLRLADLQWIWKPTKFRAACTVVKQYATHFVQLALSDMAENGEEAASKQYPFIIELYKDLQDFLLVRDQLVYVLIAGRDTTACLMSWAFFLLVRHPKTLAKLRSEIHQVTEGSPELTRARIKRMKYLRCVLNKTQRLYPQLPMNVRVAAKTTVIPSGGGPDCKSPVLIPQGHTDMKELLRWYVHKTNGRKSENGRPVMSSVLNCAERLFGGFEETVGITIVEEDRSDIFNLHRHAVDQENIDSK
ncbi:hypothetical protein N7513_003583 [Penicillium frequentans]|nr:hypothetical protein N7513_003583 [Penicillium glabrum]